MLKNLVLLSGLLLTSLSAQATLISHFGYERDSASNIVTGGGLEWLKWDVTKGMSISSALSTYATQGWRLASNDEMALLFNKFEFGKTDWDNRPTGFGSQWSYSPWTAEEFSGVHSHFIHLFGMTAQLSCASVDEVSCYASYDPLIITRAFYGSDDATEERRNAAVVWDDATLITASRVAVELGHGAELLDTYGAFEQPMVGYAVALVRQASTQPIEVSTPGSIGLLALGLVALGYRRRQVLGR